MQGSNNRRNNRGTFKESMRHYAEDRAELVAARNLVGDQFPRLFKMQQSGESMMAAKMDLSAPLATLRRLMRKYDYNGILDSDLNGLVFDKMSFNPTQKSQFEYFLRSLAELLYKLEDDLKKYSLGELSESQFVRLTKNEETGDWYIKFNYPEPEPGAAAALALPEAAGPMAAAALPEVANQNYAAAPMAEAAPMAAAAQNNNPNMAPAAPGGPSAAPGGGRRKSRTRKSRARKTRKAKSRKHGGRRH
jgi:hypothetical protein